ncbi:type II toxin-antitoxin system VapC family toxin [Caballeronia sp. DA-9]|uniref:type II toxin-antitoxin system VapC family toxin n=1 Tax=Caballeronia sp. DA-9 TaxID=3436237 RepID=UPI003F67566D
MERVKRYMLDTNTVSHLIKRHTSVMPRLEAVSISSVCISAITEGELLFGLAKRPDAIKLRRSIHEFLLRANVLPWDTLVAEEYGTLRAELEQLGKSLAPMDLLIGAHARCVDAVLVSNDRVFQHVPNLKLEDWTE